MQCISYSHFFSKKFQHICVSLDVNFNESLTNDVVSFEQLGPEFLVEKKKSTLSGAITSSILLYKMQVKYGKVQKCLKVQDEYGTPISWVYGITVEECFVR